jgi:hypothetical protein
MNPSMFPALSGGAETTRPEKDGESQKPDDDEEKDPDDEKPE